MPFSLVERSNPKMLENRLRNFTWIPLSNPMTISGRYKLHAFVKIRGGGLLPPSFTPCLQKSTVDKMQGIMLIQFSRAQITRIRRSRRDLSHTTQQHGMAKKISSQVIIMKLPLVKAFHTLHFRGKREAGVTQCPTDARTH